MNLILEGTLELLGVDEGVESSRVLGLVVVKGSQVFYVLGRFKASACEMGTKSYRILMLRLRSDVYSCMNWWVALWLVL